MPSTSGACRLRSKKARRYYAVIYILVFPPAPSRQFQFFLLPIHEISELARVRIWTELFPKDGCCL